MENNSNKIITLSNALSFFRLLLSVPLAFALIYNNVLYVILIGILALLSDNLDGYFARRFNQISEFGKIIDPLADKVFVGTFAVMMLINGIMPVWYALVLLVRDVLILIGGLYLSKKLKYVVPSDMFGKGTVLLISITLLILLLRIEAATIPLLIISSLACLASLINYIIRMLKLMKNN